jgi:hypothetical protein
MGEHVERRHLRNRWPGVKYLKLFFSLQFDNWTKIHMFSSICANDYFYYHKIL